MRYVDPAYERFARVKAADIVGRTAFECFPEADRNTVERIGVADRLEKFSGWMDLHYESIMYSPQPGQCVAVWVDITERSRAEARRRRLIDSNVQGVMFWKSVGPIVGANDAFLRIAGYSRDDLETGVYGRRQARGLLNLHRHSCQGDV